MSGHEIARWRTIAQAYPCTTCGAAPGMPCVTTAGVAKSEVHVRRSRLASENGWRHPDEQEES